MPDSFFKEDDCLVIEKIETVSVRKKISMAEIKGRIETINCQIDGLNIEKFNLVKYLEEASRLGLSEVASEKGADAS